MSQKKKQQLYQKNKLATRLVYFWEENEQRLSNAKHRRKFWKWATRPSFTVLLLKHNECNIFHFYVISNFSLSLFVSVQTYYCCVLAKLANLSLSIMTYVGWLFLENWRIKKRQVSNFEEFLRTSSQWVLGSLNHTAH